MAHIMVTTADIGSLWKKLRHSHPMNMLHSLACVLFRQIKILSRVNEQKYASCLQVKKDVVTVFQVPSVLSVQNLQSCQVQWRSSALRGSAHVYN